MQLNVSPERKTSPLGTCQHGWADVDADDLGLRWVKLNISTSSNTRIQHPSLEPLEEQGPYLAIAAILEGKIEQVIERCDPLVPVQIGWHPVSSYLKENSEARP
jgi:hypothetical protein